MRALVKRLLVLVLTPALVLLGPTGASLAQTAPPTALPGDPPGRVGRQPYASNTVAGTPGPITISAGSGTSGPAALRDALPRRVPPRPVLLRPALLRPALPGLARARRSSSWCHVSCLFKQRRTLRSVGVAWNGSNRLGSPASSPKRPSSARSAARAGSGTV